MHQSYQIEIWMGHYLHEFLQNSLPCKSIVPMYAMTCIFEFDKWYHALIMLPFDQFKSFYGPANSVVSWVMLIYFLRE